MFRYPISWFGARLLAKLKVNLSVRVKVEFDPEANVYIASSPDLTGLILEAETVEEMINEIAEWVPNLLNDQEQPLAMVESTITHHQPLAHA